MKSKFTRIVGVVLPLVTVLALAVTLLPVAKAPTAEAAVENLRFGTLPLPKFGGDGKFVLTPGMDVTAIAVDSTGLVMFAAVDPEADTILYRVTTAIAVAPMTLTINYLDQGGAASVTPAFTIAVGTAAGTEVAIPLEAGDTAVLDITGITDGSAVTCTGAVSILSTKSRAILARVSDTSATLTGTVTLFPDLLLKSTDGGLTWTEQADFRLAANVAPVDATDIVEIVVSPAYVTDTTIYVATLANVYESLTGGTRFTRLPLSRALAATEEIRDIDVALDETKRASLIVGTFDTGAGVGDVFVRCPATTGSAWVEQSLDRDVLAVAFSPRFSADEGIFAVTLTATNTVMRATFGRTRDGGGWGANIGDATFLHLGLTPMLATRAGIGFPTDFDIYSITANIAFVGLSVGIYNDVTVLDEEKGDVFKVVLKTAATSSVEDLNVRGIIGGVTRTATNIYSIAVTDKGDAATILVGCNFWSTAPAVGTEYWVTYISTDSGRTWSAAREKSPTGGSLNFVGGLSGFGAGAACQVLLDPKFKTTKKAWAATSGVETSALSLTKDAGVSWNQISLMDWLSAASPYRGGTLKADLAYAKTLTLYALITSPTTIGTLPTRYGRPALFETKDGGVTWTRIFCYANPTATNAMDSFDITGDKAFFIRDRTNDRFWRSMDMGATFPRPIAGRGVPGAIMVATSFRDQTTIWTVYSNGAVWFTTQAGMPWEQPDESIVSGSPINITFRESIVLIGNAVGEVFISTDNGTTFKYRLGTRNPGAASAYVTTDPAYATNKFVYCTIGYGATVGDAAGIWRIKVDEKNPSATDWERIDKHDTWAVGWATVEPTVAFDLLGVFYCWDDAVVNLAGNVGGMWRSTNPRDDVTGIYPPEWRKFQTNLRDGDQLAYASYATTPNTIFAWNRNAAGAYYDQLIGFADTLSTAVAAVAPADKAIAAGQSLSTVDLTMSEIVSWRAVTGATQYHLQVSRTRDFSSLVTFVIAGVPTVNPVTVGQEMLLTGLLPGQTYYWRVRTNAPLNSPWSTARSFTLGASAAAAAVKFQIAAPKVGATDVPVKPIFQWSEFVGAIGYEIMVSEFSDFSILEYSRNVSRTFFESEEALAYGRTYYWRVRGVTGPAPEKMPAPGGPWAEGMFTTEKKPVEPKPTVIVEKEPAPPPQIVQVQVPQPAPIPDYLLWTIIVIGGVLVIALIVLIVRTRRVT